MLFSKRSVVFKFMVLENHFAHSFVVGKISLLPVKGVLVLAFGICHNINKSIFG